VTAVVGCIVGGDGCAGLGVSGGPYVEKLGGAEDGGCI